MPRIHPRPAALLAALLALGGCRPAPRAAPAHAGQDAATVAMAERLAALEKSYAPYRLFVNPARLGNERDRLARDPAPTFERRLSFAQELLNAGESRESRDLLLELLKQAPSGREAEVRSWLGIASLRLGEQENCVLRHSPQSCLLPIRGAGVHALKTGAEAAIEHFTAALNLNEDLASRWLLNLAYMTAGRYPDAVPARWLIPPRAFETAAPFPRFPDKAREAGLDVTGHAGGAVTEDFRRAGVLDILVSAQGLSDQLRYFRNEGDGRFTERTDEAGLRGITGGLNLLEADYDNDGATDVLVLRGAWQMQGGEEPLSLLRNNGDGTFRDVTAEAGLLGDYQTQAAAWADFDGDGRLDLLVCNEAYPSHSHPCRLFHGEPGGTFSDITGKSKLDVDAMVKSVAVGDYNDDGRPDIFFAIWGEGNRLLRQEPEGTFVDVTAAAGVSAPEVSFPSWFFDYDNDGRLDLIVFGFLKPDFTIGLTQLGRDALLSVAADYLGLPFSDGKPRLYRNKGDGSFADVTDEAGLNHALFAMGANFGDLDNDGFPDFYLGTGVPDLRGLMPNRLFRNDAGRRFLDVTSAADVGHLQKGHAVSLGDLNNDGYPDIFTVLGGVYEGDVFQRALFANPGGANHWVQLTLEGTRANRSALGARIKVEARTPRGTRTVYAVVSSGASFGASGLRQTLGLGDGVEVLSVEVRWPRRDAAVERFTGVGLDGQWRLTEGAAVAAAQVPRRFAW